MLESFPFMTALTGLGFGLSLIVAIGAQNAFVLRQGLRREHVGEVVAICAASDIVLISLGIAGVGAIADSAPWFIPVMTWGGAAFLIVYGLLAARRAVRPSSLDADPAGAPLALSTTIVTCLAFTWLNPHVYLDTVILLGTVANSHGAGRWWFGLGAAVGSVAWFSALGFGARFLRPLFRAPVAWRTLDGLIAVVMIVLAVSLLVRA